MNKRIMTPVLAGLAASILSAQVPPVRAETGADAPHLRGSARCKASQLIGCAITNSKNESLGEIQDIVLDSRNQRIAYAVVAFGGFLGMGEKYFAMPWRLIEVTQRGTDDAPRATLGLDKETLKAAPGFDQSNWPDMGNPTWAGQVDDYYRLRNEGARPEGAAEPKGSGAEGKAGVAQAPASKAFAHRRFTKLIGMNVVDTQGKSLADVEDLIVDPRKATIDAALLSFGGTLGIGENLVLVPLSAVMLDAAKNVWVLPCTHARLEAMALPSGKLPALNNDEWLTKCTEACAKARAEVAVTNGDVIVADASGVKPVPFADTYDPKVQETVKGTITSVGSVWIGDQQEERVRLRVRASDGRELIVYAAPASWSQQQALGLRSGKKLEVRGSPAKYGSQTVLVAGMITVDGKSATLRDELGHVAWAKQ